MEDALLTKQDKLKEAGRIEDARLEAAYLRKQLEEYKELWDQEKFVILRLFQSMDLCYYDTGQSDNDNKKPAAALQMPVPERSESGAEMRNL